MRRSILWSIVKKCQEIRSEAGEAPDPQVGSGNDEDLESLRPRTDRHDLENKSQTPLDRTSSVRSDTLQESSGRGLAYLGMMTICYEG